MNGKVNSRHLEEMVCTEVYQVLSAIRESHCHTSSSICFMSQSSLRHWQHHSSLIKIESIEDHTRCRPTTMTTAPLWMYNKISTSVLLAIKGMHSSDETTEMSGIMEYSVRLWQMHWADESGCLAQHILIICIITTSVEEQGVMLTPNANE